MMNTSQHKNFQHKGVKFIAVFIGSADEGMVPVFVTRSGPYKILKSKEEAKSWVDSSNN